MAEAEADARSWEVCLAGCAGGFIAALIDTIKNTNASTVTRLTQVVQENLLPGSHMEPIWSLVFIACLGSILCWIYLPKNMADAFARGISIMAVLNVTSPAIPPKPSQDSAIETISSDSNKTVSKLDNDINEMGTLSLVFDFFFQAAHADTSSSTISILTPESYIYLKGITQSDLDSPNSSVIIREANSSKVVAYETIDKNILAIRKPSGKYIVEVNIPNYRRVQFTIGLDALMPASAYAITLKKSLIPIGAQMLFAADNRNLEELDSDMAKQIGVYAAHQKSFDNAVLFYDKSLDLASNDYKIINYKAYALYRTGKYKEALDTINKSIAINSDYAISKLNKVKILCAIGNPFAAKSLIQSDETVKNISREDGEILKVCPKDTVASS
jgi:hypothetical protein